MSELVKMSYLISVTTLLLAIATPHVQSQGGIGIPSSLLFEFLRVRSD